MKKLTCFALTLLLVFSCKTYSEDNLNEFDAKIQNYLNKSKLKYEKSESGLYYHIEREGDGSAIKLSDHVSFTYEGKLINGKVFDNRYKKRPVEFQVSELIAGWKEALMYIRPGGKIHLIVPPQLGYGDYDLDDIPKNSILLFELELLAVR